MEVGKKLIKARKYLDLTQEQVADILHMSVDKIKEYEERHYISLTELKPFLKLYGLKKEDLYENDKDISVSKNLSKKDKKEVRGLFKLLQDFKKRR